MKYCIRRTTWSQDKKSISRVRKKVFVQEQQVPARLEFDEYEEYSLHLLAEDKNGQAVATARIVNGKIGRLAVLKTFRGRGIGRALMTELLQVAREQDLSEVHLDAQVQAMPFYQSFGFKAVGDVFEDAGIPHRRMFFSLVR